MKFKRQNMILELIKENPIETHNELIKKLSECGFEVTQATVSRDIRQLGIIKADDGTGRFVYVSQKSSGTEKPDEKYIRVLKEGLISMDQAENILVIKTESGMAMAVAAALDEFSWSELVGSVAGDDTIICAIRYKAAVKNVMERIKKIVGK